MHVVLQNDAGLTKEVKAGISWTAFFFGPLPFFFRDLPGKGVLGIILCLCTINIYYIYLIFAMNKITAKHWMEHGYKPVGPGWDIIGPKWGVSLTNLGHHGQQQTYAPQQPQYQQPQVAQQYPQAQQIQAPQAAEPAPIRQG